MPASRCETMPFEASRLSAMVVFPWSTCAMMQMLRAVAADEAADEPDHREAANIEGLKFSMKHARAWAYKKAWAQQNDDPQGYEYFKFNPKNFTDDSINQMNTEIDVAGRELKQGDELAIRQ